MNRPDDSESPSTPSEIDAILDFLSAAGALKDTLRSAHTARGRQEDSASHSWRLALWAFAVADVVPDLDHRKLLEICLLHDLGEAITGDVPATEQSAHPSRKADERAAMETFADRLPPVRGQRLLELYDEYETGSTPEARFARGLDKLETILQHLDGRNPASFDYAFNLDYGRARTEAHPLIRAIRVRLDAATRARQSDQSGELAEPS